MLTRVRVEMTTVKESHLPFVMEYVMDYSCWVQLEPLPDGVWEVYFKPENHVMRLHKFIETRLERYPYVVHYLGVDGRSTIRFKTLAGVGKYVRDRYLGVDYIRREAPSPGLQLETAKLWFDGFNWADIGDLNMVAEDPTFVWKEFGEVTEDAGIEEHL